MEDSHPKPSLAFGIGGITPRARVNTLKTKYVSIMEKMQVRNRMSASQLVVSQNSSLQFINNPNTNKVFFMCGNVKGYISPAVAAKMDTVGLEDLQYAECAKPGTNDWVPCLMMVGNSNANVKRSLGDNLLR